MKLTRNARIAARNYRRGQDASLLKYPSALFAKTTRQLLKAKRSKKR